MSPSFYGKSYICQHSEILKQARATVDVSLPHQSTSVVYIRQKKQSRLKHFYLTLMGYGYLCATYCYIFVAWLGLIK